MNKYVKSEKLYTPQTYCEKLTGCCYGFDHEDTVFEMKQCSGDTAWNQSIGAIRYQKSITSWKTICVWFLLTSLALAKKVNGSRNTDGLRFLRTLRRKSNE